MREIMKRRLRIFSPVFSSPDLYYGDAFIEGSEDRLYIKWDYCGSMKMKAI
jgi:hypothetical protein